MKTHVPTTEFLEPLKPQQNTGRKHSIKMPGEKAKISLSYKH
jgi:hypothetical protein